MSDERQISNDPRQRQQEEHALVVPEENEQWVGRIMAAYHHHPNTTTAGVALQQPSMITTVESNGRNLVQAPVVPPALLMHHPQGGNRSCETSLVAKTPTNHPTSQQLILNNTEGTDLDSLHSFRPSLYTPRVSPPQALLMERSPFPAVMLTTPTTTTTNTTPQNSNPRRYIEPGEATSQLAAVVVPNACERAPLSLGAVTTGGDNYVEELSLPRHHHRTILADNTDNNHEAADLLQEPLLLLPVGQRRQRRHEQQAAEAVAEDASPDQQQPGLWQYYFGGLGCCFSRGTRTPETSTDYCQNSSVLVVQSLIIAVVLLALVQVWMYHLLETKLCPSSASQQHSRFPAVERFQALLECAAQWSETVPGDNDFPANNEIQSAAVEWFLTGPGRNMAIVDKDCPVDGNSSFSAVYALIVLRGSLKVPDASWYSSSAVHTLQDVCHWARVTCSSGGDDDSNKKITGLSLQQANLTGSIPGEIAGLHHLTSLEMYSNPALTGALPESLSRMPALQHLKLQQTGISGTIPTAFGQMTALQELLLDHTGITGCVPDELCQLPALQHFHVPDAVSCSCCKTQRD